MQGDDDMAETMTASEMTDGQIENAVDKLRAAMRKHRSEISSGIAQQVLGVENLGMEMFTPFRKRAEAMRGPVFPVYLDIEVGGKSANELLAEIKSAGTYVSDWARDIMAKSAWKPGEREQVKFARAKVRELGFTTRPTTAQIWTRIRELGHGHALCEPCDGPAIRLALGDQPRSDYFWVAMEQITDSDGSPSVFYVGRRGDGERWLYAGWVYPDYGWYLDDEIVFRLRK